MSTKSSAESSAERSTQQARLTFRPRTLTRRIIIHDSHSLPPPGVSAVAHMRVKGREMGLLEVGYHMVIERDGKVVCCRPHHVLGSHTPGANGDSVGVCLAGGAGGEPDYGPGQMPALMALLSFLQSEYPETPLRVLGHSEVHSNRRHACPAIPMQDLRAQLRNHIDVTEQTPEPVGPDGLSAQNRLVLEYLQPGRTLTNMVALTCLGVGSLSSRIAELRRLGHEIETSTARGPQGNTYTKYKLASKPADAEAA